MTAQLRPARLLALAMVWPVVGCALTDPYQREGVWRPNGANDINLQAMVAVPGDLAHGVGDGNSDGRQAEAALDRLRRNAVKDLPDSGLAEVKLAPNGSKGSGGGSSSAAAP